MADFELKDSPTLAECKVISKFVIKKFEEGAFDTVEIYYSRFVNTLSQSRRRALSAHPHRRGASRHGKALGRRQPSARSRPTVRDGKGGTTLVYNFQADAAELLGNLLPYSATST